MNIFNKIYYINLTTDFTKKIYFETQLSHTCLHRKYDRFTGVDGSLLDIRLIDKNIITNNAFDDIVSQNQKRYGVSLTYGSLGCALSHYLIYSECSKSIGPFLIFEDDIIVNNNFDKNLYVLLENISNIEYDIVYLGYNSLPSLQLIGYNNVLSKPKGLITGLYAYILSNNGAKKILNTVFPINKQLDSSISDNLDKINAFCATEKLVSVNTSFGSRTQQEPSYKNIMHHNHLDDWDKLFIL